MALLFFLSNDTLKIDILTNPQCVSPRYISIESVNKGDIFIKETCQI